MLFLSMLLMGGIIGFVGAGGSGVIITLLVVGFGVPIHQALAVALGSMAFTTLSGAISHYREREVVPLTGAVLGMGGSSVRSSEPSSRTIWRRRTSVCSRA